MKNESSLDNLLSKEQWRHAETILEHTEIVILSCLYWWMDQQQIIAEEREIADSLLYIPVQGRIHCRVGSKEAVLGPGEFMMVPEGVRHDARRVESDGDDLFQAYSIHAHAYTMHGHPLFALFSSPFGQLSGMDGWFKQLALLVHLMGKDLQVGQHFGNSLVRSMVLQQLVEGNPLVNVPRADDKRIWTSMLYILKHFADPLSVNNLAQRAGVSPVQFRKLFKRHTGISPQRYIQQTRLRKARALLSTNLQMTIKEVAARTGFSSANYLHAAFKEEYGTTPASCRSVSRETPDRQRAKSPSSVSEPR
ncbi:MAG: helix-turn-helix domain-containing protein [bacterium]